MKYINQQRSRSAAFILLALPSLFSPLKAQLKKRQVETPRMDWHQVTAIAVSGPRVYWVRNGQLYLSILTCCKGQANQVVSGSGDVLNGSGSLVSTSGVNWGKAKLVVRKTGPTPAPEEDILYWAENGDLHSGGIVAMTLVDVKVIAREGWNVTGLALRGSYVWAQRSGQLIAAVLGGESIGPVSVQSAEQWSGAGPIAAVDANGTDIYWLTQNRDLMRGQFGAFSSTPRAPGAPKVVAQNFSDVFAVVNGLIFWTDGSSLFQGCEGCSNPTFR